MTLTDPSQLPLRDIHLPASIGLWPPAPGWWVVAALGFGVPLGLWLSRTWRRRQRLRREVLREFAALASSSSSPHAFAVAMDLLLRRIALALEPARAPGAGEAWLQQLQRVMPGLVLDDQMRCALLQAPYDPKAQFDLPNVRAQLEKILRRLPRRALPVTRV